MTISTTIIKNSYSGDGSVVAFTYAFKIADATFIQVIVKTNATGAESVRAIGTGTTNYAVSGVGEASGGTVTFVTAPTSAETVVLRRSTTQTQALDLIENDNLPANSLETAFDKNLSIAQELQEQIDRSFKISRANTITSSEFTDSATARASKTLGFDSSGDLTTVADFLPAGGDSAQFTYSTTTADADPGAGFIRFNNATISSATIAYVDDAEANGTDVVAWVQSFDDVAGNKTNRGRIRVSKANTLDTWHVFKVNAAITDASGYTKIPLTYIDGAGSLANNDKVFLSFVASGEDGAIPGYSYTFDAGTSDADPGAGDIAFNNATYANVTEIYIDDADANGGATQADTATWGSSTSTIKGFLHIVDINDSSTYARFKITAAVDDESGYNKITVVHLASNNTFSAADELSVHFTRTGLKGDTGSTGSTGSTGATGDVSLAGTQTLTNKTLTAPKINEDVAVTSTATELNKLDALSRGSILYGNASAVTSILTKGSANQILISDGTDIAWGANTVANNAITLAKMAAGTDGNIISYDASGDPVAIATGNDGQVLTSTGAGSAPAFEDAAGGGAFTLLSTTTISTAVAQVNISANIDSTYKNYMWLLTDIKNINNDVKLRVQVFSADGSPDTGTHYINAGSGHRSDNSNVDMNSTGAVHAEITLAGASDEGHRHNQFTMFMYNPSGTDSYKQFHTTVQQTVGDNKLVVGDVGFTYRKTIAITGLRFKFSGGNMSRGIFKLYGIN